MGVPSRGVPAWPELAIVGEAVDGDEAVSIAGTLRPDVAFLAIRMPVKTGLDVAREISSRCHIVFATAFDEYAVAAFEEGAISR